MRYKRLINLCIKKSCKIRYKKILRAYESVIRFGDTVSLLFFLCCQKGITDSLIIPQVYGK